MAANPNRHPPADIESANRQSITLNYRTAELRSNPGLDQTVAYQCDSAFLAERGIFSKSESVRFAAQSKPGAHRQSGEAS
jgi:hypothetical protein